MGGGNCGFPDSIRPYSPTVQYSIVFVYIYIKPCSLRVYCVSTDMCSACAKLQLLHALLGLWLIKWVNTVMVS